MKDEILPPAVIKEFQIRKILNVLSTIFLILLISQPIITGFWYTQNCQVFTNLEDVETRITEIQYAPVSNEDNNYTSPWYFNISIDFWVKGPVSTIQTAPSVKDLFDFSLNASLKNKTLQNTYEPFWIRSVLHNNVMGFARAFSPNLYHREVLVEMGVWNNIRGAGDLLDGNYTIFCWDESATARYSATIYTENGTYTYSYSQTPPDWGQDTIGLGYFSFPLAFLILTAGLISLMPFFNKSLMIKFYHKLSKKPQGKFSPLFVITIFIFIVNGMIIATKL